MNEKWVDLFSETIEREKERMSSYVLEYPKGVTNEDLSKAENLLQFELPVELRSLLMEFDGIHEFAITDNDEKIQTGSIIWSLASMVDWHISQTLPNKTALFCFGNSALGNCFGYLLESGRPKDDEIWQSAHETLPPDEYLIKRASNLREFITTSLAESLWF
jgi:hypothetical protein